LKVEEHARLEEQINIPFDFHHRAQLLPWREMQDPDNVGKDYGSGSGRAVPSYSASILGFEKAVRALWGG
jgi:hypothetical protein